MRELLSPLNNTFKIIKIWYIIISDMIHYIYKKNKKYLYFFNFLQIT